MKHFSALAALFLFLLTATAAPAATLPSSFSCVARTTTDAPPPVAQLPAVVDQTQRTKQLPRVCPQGEVPKLTKKVVSSTGVNKPKQMGVKSRGAAPPSGPGNGILYGGSYQYALRQSQLFTPGAYNGFSTMMTQHKPSVSGDGHSVGQLWAIDNRYGYSSVETGWSVEPNQWTDNDTHLFVANFDRGIFRGYVNDPVLFDPSTYTWVQYSSSVYPGMKITPDGQYHQFAMQMHNNKWWIYYDYQAIGYYPIPQNWGYAFAPNFTEVGGETQSTSTASCTDMGSGISPFASYAASAKVDALGRLPAEGPYAYQRTDLTTYPYSNGYSVAQNPTTPATDSFGFGGPGPC